MERKLTTSDQGASDFRIARSDNHDCSIEPPHTSTVVGSSGSETRTTPHRKDLEDDGRQAAHRRGVSIEVDAQIPTLKREPDGDRRRFQAERHSAPPLDGSHFLPKSHSSVIGSHDVLRFQLPEAIAGRSKGEPCGHVARKGSRINGSLVRSAFGRGRS